MNDMSASLESMGIQGTGQRVKKPLSRKEKIEEELKLLEWHKMANDAAIKASLMQNKQLRESEPHAIPAHTDDDAKWMKKVIQQEHIKPLEVNKEFVLEYERREKENEERLTLQLERHIGTLQKLRGKLEAKAEMKQRTDEYRSWQREFHIKKNEVMLGKTLAEIESSKENKLPSTTAKRNVNGKKVGEGNPLQGVLESLNKLSDLENRITSLEKDNVYERMVQQERPSADRRTVLDFKKSRVVKGTDNNPGHGPMAVVYSMKPKQKSWQVNVPGLTKPAASKRGIPPMRGRGGDDDDDDDEGGGTFALTGIDAGGTGGGRTNPKLERARKLHDASAGQKGLRSRVQSKKGRQNDVKLGLKKHQEALSELNRRRNEQQIQRRPARGAAALAAGTGKGASSGMKSSNRHLNDFQKTKQNLQKRTSNLKKNLASTDPRGMRGAKSSRSAPAMSTVSGTGLNNNTRRMPNIRGGNGNGASVTRRTNQPTRRGMGSTQNGGPSTAPAVGGVGGIRALRNKRQNNA
jgi:hypothetical protein